MARYQIIDDGKKINVIEWDGESPFGQDPAWIIEPDDGSPIWEPPAPVPERSTNSDWRKAIRRMGKLAQVEAIVQAAKDSGTDEGADLYEEFHYANHVYRDRLQAIAALFGFTPEQVDESLTLAGPD